MPPRKVCGHSTPSPPTAELPHGGSRTVLDQNDRFLAGADLAGSRDACRYNIIFRVCVGAVSVPPRKVCGHLNSLTAYGEAPSMREPNSAGKKKRRCIRSVHIGRNRFFADIFSASLLPNLIRHTVLLRFGNFENEQNISATKLRDT